MGAPLPVQAAVLGLVQGLTEFLPVSSSGHLEILPRLLGWHPLGKAFDVSLHFGTLVALTAHFREELLERRRLWGWLCLGSLPAGLVGFFGETFIDRHFAGLLSVTVCLGLFGLVLGLADQLARGSREVGQLTAARVLWIGLAQALALLPGASRSGVTITAGLAVGLTRAEAAHFGFLLGLPITLAACLYKFATCPEILREPNFLIGAVVSAVTGWLTLRFMLGFLRRHTYRPFAVYRVAVSLAVLGWIVRQS